MLNRYLTSGNLSGRDMKQLLTHDADLHKIDFYGMDRSNARLSERSVTSGLTRSSFSQAVTSRPPRAGGEHNRLRRVNSFAGVNIAESRRLPNLPKRGSCDITPRSTGSDRWSESTEQDSSARTEVTNRAGPPQGVGQAWSVFTEHVKCIDVNTMYFQEKKLTPKSSTDFREVLTKMRGELDNTDKTAQTNYARALNLSTHNQYHVNTARSSSQSISIDTLPAKQVEPIVEGDGSSDNGEVDELGDNGPTEDEVDGGKRRVARGWSIMRRGLHEQLLEHRKAHTAVGWNLLQHTLDQMTDAERARQTLYERYLYDPDPNSWASGLVNYPQFLLDRKQRTAAGRKRPFSSAPTAGRPPRSRLTSAVHRPGKTPARAAKKPPGLRPRSTQSLPNRPRQTNSSLSMR
ncbi:hypothetical protein NP493_439g05022 [Ridgeia piscesae]|uniref:Uncharacterized protein n=1 Tax=Ridgeia piscesae TaxID=27915 RepID=A0AAD9KZH2_RIDPI|nr:hypothetical protein NP493_439g05022 [Ridgeia piscesae]